MIKILDKILLSDDVVNKFHLQLNDKEFKKWLSDFLPEILMCQKQQQNNPWHKYNVLDHILNSAQQMNLQTKHLDESERRLLAYVMFFHDIGKPQTHIVRKKDGKMIDSFFGHNKKSCEIAKEKLSQLSFDENEQKIILKLVDKHDIFMFIKDGEFNNPHWRRLNHKLIEEEIDDLNQVGDGVKLMKYLVMVGRSDNLAQNEKMTGEALKLLDKFDSLIEEREMTEIPFS